MLPDHHVKVEERIVSISYGHEVIPMITSKMVKVFKPKYEFMHIGLIQVVVKPLVRKGLDTAMLLYLKDSRLTYFQDSLLGIVETSLYERLIYFNYYTDLIVNSKAKTSLRP